LRAMALAAAGLGLLPWMHRKFIPFAAGLLFVLAWRHRAWLGRLAFSTVAGLALLIVVPVIAQSLSTAATWGDAGGPLLREGLPFSWHALQRGAPGLLFDRENGLFVWAPIYLIMPAAWWITRRETWPLLVPALLLYLPSAAHDAWWGGWSPVGRFLLPLVPLAAVPAVRALAAPTIRRAALALLMPQAVMSAMAWQMPHVLWPRGQGVNLGLAAIPVAGARVQAWLPSLRHEGVDARLWAALAIVLAGNAALALFGRRALAGGGPPSAGA